MLFRSIIYTNKCVYGFGEIIGEHKTGEPPGVKKHPYKNWRKVCWLKIVRIKASQLPPSVSHKVTRDPAGYIKKLDREIWETLMILS